MSTAKNKKAWIGDGVIAIFIVAIILIVALSGGGGGGHAKQNGKSGASLTISTRSASGKTFQTTLNCAGVQASASTINVGSPPEACGAAQRVPALLTAQNECGPGQESALVSGSVNGQKVRGYLSFCNETKAKTLGILPLLPVAALNPSSLPPSTRNGLIFAKQGSDVAVILTQPTSPTIEKQLRGQKIAISCDTDHGRWNTTLVWPANATQVSVHPNGLPRRCRLLLQGRVSVTADF